MTDIAPKKKPPEVGVPCLLVAVLAKLREVSNAAIEGMPTADAEAMARPFQSAATPWAVLGLLDEIELLAGALSSALIGCNDQLPYEVRRPYLDAAKAVHCRHGESCLPDVVFRALKVPVQP